MGDNSTLCELAAAPTLLFRHDPYNASCAKVFFYSSSACAIVDPFPVPAESEVPELLHPELVHRLRYVAFPPPAEVTSLADPPKEYLKRLFIGQLPLLFTDRQLEHAIASATGGRRVLHIERIVNWKQNRAPTGCAHAYCRAEDQAAIVSGSKRVLFDSMGVWVAEPGAEAAMLESYMRTVPAPPRPYTTGRMTVEKAKSSYVPDARFCIKAFAQEW